MILIDVSEVTGCQYCIAADSADMLAKIVRILLLCDEKVALNFREMDTATCFFSEFIFGLYEAGISDTDIDERLVFYGLSNTDVLILGRTRNRVRDYIADPDIFERIYEDYVWG